MFLHAGGEDSDQTGHFVGFVRAHLIAVTACIYITQNSSGRKTTCNKVP